MANGRDIISMVGERQDLTNFRKSHWQGTFAEYLDLVRQDPQVTRNAYQRIYDMIMSYGTETYEACREKRTHYRFFDDPVGNGRDAVFGLDTAIESLVNAFKSAAKATASRNACCCCTVPSAAARARSRAC